MMSNLYRSFADFLYSNKELKFLLERTTFQSRYPYILQCCLSKIGAKMALSLLEQLDHKQVYFFLFRRDSSLHSLSLSPCKKFVWNLYKGGTEGGAGWSFFLVKKYIDSCESTCKCAICHINFQRNQNKGGKL